VTTSPQQKLDGSGANYHCPCYVLCAVCMVLYRPFFLAQQ